MRQLITNWNPTSLNKKWSQFKKSIIYQKLSVKSIRNLKNTIDNGSLFI